jgi:hypothetical protein
MTGHVTDSATPRRLDGICATRRCARRSAIGTACAARVACPRGWTSTPAMMRPHLQDAAILEVARPGSLRIRLGGARINALWAWTSGPAAPGAVRPVGTRPHLGRGGGGDRRTRASSFSTCVPRAALRAARGRGTLRAQIAVLPMTDADLAPTRALYVMGAMNGEPRKADAPHRWCATQIHALPLRAGEPVLTERPPDPARGPPRAPPRTRPPAKRAGPMARARFRVIEGGLS